MSYFYKGANIVDMGRALHIKGKKPKKSTNRKRIKVFTHTDLDGVGCSLVAIFFKYDSYVDVEYLDYNEINERISEWLDEYDNEDMQDKYTECFITDISVNEDLAERIDKSKINFKLMDHHPTALWLNKYEWCNVRIEKEDIKTCGTEMIYDYMIESCDIKKFDDVCLKRIKKMVEVIRNWDTWRWTEIEDGKISSDVNRLCSLYDKKEFVDWALDNIMLPVEYDDVMLMPLDIRLLRVEDSKMNKYASIKEKEMIIVKDGERSAGVVFSDRYTSELGNFLCNEHPEVDYIALVNIGSGTVSLRSVREDIDLGKEVASKYGGGGHPRSAGFRVGDISKLRTDIAKTIFH